MVKIQFKFNEEQDYINYLGMIIEHLDKYLARYKYYRKEIEELCLTKYREIRPETTQISSELIKELCESEGYYEERKKYKLIPYYKYIKLSDMLNYVNLKILNIIGDRSKEGVSYLKFKDKIKEASKKGDFLGFELDDLPQEMREKLNLCNDSRNYLAHICDSVVISQLDYRRQQVEDMEQLLGINSSKLIKETQNIIYSNRYDYVEVEWVYQMYLSYLQSLSVYSSIFQQIKRDFAKIIGEKVNIMQISNRALPFDYSSITLDSINMQRKPKKEDKSI